jgi:CYTH domain-containing protein
MPDSIPLEIERKYLISMPDEKLLQSLSGVRSLDITQTYLLTPPGASSERVRQIREGGRTRYTHTVKRRLSPLTAEEAEEEIDRERYALLLALADPRLSAINKRRYVFFIDSQCYEVDIYHFWKSTAMLETELDDENKIAKTPSFLHVIKEITGEKRYSNHSLAAFAPPDPTL